MSEAPHASEADRLGPPEAWSAFAARDDAEPILAEVTDRLTGRDMEPSPSDVSRWRKRLPADALALAIAVARARARHGWKCRAMPGEDAVRAWFDVQAGEQATPWPVAAHKAELFRRVGAGRVLDLCCGAGADAREFVRGGLEVAAVDRSPSRAWQAARNAPGVSSDVAGAEDVDVTDAWVHIDPARRDEAGARAWSLAAHQPGPEVLAQILAGARGAAVALGPGADCDALAALAPGVPACGEFISLRREGGGVSLNQLVWWTGELAGALDTPRVATGLDLERGLVFRIEGEPGDPPMARFAQADALAAGSYILEADPAVERARLLGACCDEHIGAWRPGLGLLVSPDEPSARPMLRAFEVLRDEAFSERRLRASLRDLGVGAVTVKTRAGAADPDTLVRALSGDGERSATVFVLRIDGARRAIITRAPWDA